MGSPSTWKEQNSASLAMRFKRAVKLSVADRYYKMQEKGIVQPVHSKNIKVRKK